MHLDHRDLRPIYVQIIERYREQITLGILRSGERLPSVRELAVELSINPNTIQRAYRSLEMEGWIVTVPGKGCFVCGSSMAMDRERERHLQVLDEAVGALLTLGLTREQIAARITKEVKKNA